MLLQLAIDKPEHFAVLAAVADLIDIAEVGTPVLKRFGLSAISTARELAPGLPVLADTKTVDGGALEADMVFGAGASFMTVLATASAATHDAVLDRAAAFGARVVVDTITESGKAELLPEGLIHPQRFDFVAVHAPFDMRVAGRAITTHVEAVRTMHARGLRVSLAGGIGPDTIEQVIEVDPEIVVVGSAITEAANPREVTAWLRSQMA